MCKTPVLFTTRPILVIYKVLLVAGALLFTMACTSGGGAKSSTSSLDGHHALFKEWQVIDTATGRPVTLDQLTALLLKQDIIYLGEEHHNRFHIDAAVTVLRRLKAEGRTPALAMEMFGWDGQAALDQYIFGSDMTRQEFLEAVRWQQNWGGLYEDYEPLVQLAKEHHWSVDAMNPPKPLVRIVAKNGLAQAESDPMMAQWGMKGEALVDDPIYRARILQQLQDVMAGELTASIRRCSKPPCFAMKGWPRRWSIASTRSVRKAMRQLGRWSAIQGAGIFSTTFRFSSEWLAA